MKCKKLFLAIVFIGFYLTNAQTSKNVEKQSLIWARYVAQLELTKKWTVVGEVDERFFTRPAQQNLIVFRFQGRYKLNEKIEFGTGFTHFSVTTQSPDVNPGFQTPEYRTQQDITMRQRAGKFGFTQRYQFEQRFIDSYSSSGDYLGIDFFLRYRLKVQAEYRIWKAENKFLSAIVSDEVMVNGGSNVINNVFDQNRIYVAMQYGFNKNFSVELGYLNSFQKRASGLDFYDRNIIRMSVFHKFKI
jgi:hypothetical protein